MFRNTENAFKPFAINCNKSWNCRQYIVLAVKWGEGFWQLWWSVSMKLKQASPRPKLLARNWTRLYNTFINAKRSDLDYWLIKYIDSNSAFTLYTNLLRLGLYILCNLNKDLTRAKTFGLSKFWLLWISSLFYWLLVWTKFCFYFSFFIWAVCNLVYHMCKPSPAN